MKIYIHLSEYTTFAKLVQTHHVDLTYLNTSKDNAGLQRNKEAKLNSCKFMKKETHENSHQNACCKILAIKTSQKNPQNFGTILEN